MEAVFEQEYEKGEIAGVFLMSNMPARIIEDFTNDIKLQEAKLPNDSEE